MNEPVEVVRMLVLSTAHVPKDVGELLSADTYHARAEIAADPIEYGWLVYRSDAGSAEPVDPQHPGLWEAIFRLAREHGAEWLKFDCDGPIYAQLESWEW